VAVSVRRGLDHRSRPCADGGADQFGGVWQPGGPAPRHQRHERL